MLGIPSRAPQCRRPSLACIYCLSMAFRVPERARQLSRSASVSPIAGSSPRPLQIIRCWLARPIRWAQRSQTFTRCEFVCRSGARQVRLVHRKRQSRGSLCLREPSDSEHGSGALSAGRASNDDSAVLVGFAGSAGFRAASVGLLPGKQSSASHAGDPSHARAGLGELLDCGT